jgi:hypothetical protein
MSMQAALLPRLPLSQKKLLDLSIKREKLLLECSGVADEMYNLLDEIIECLMVVRVPATFSCQLRKHSVPKKELAVLQFH